MPIESYNFEIEKRIGVMTFYHQNEYPLVGTPVTICFLNHQQEWISKIEKINSDQIVISEPNKVTELSLEIGMELILTWPDVEGLGQGKCILEAIEYSPKTTYWRLRPISVFEINQRRAYPRIEIDLKVNMELEDNSILTATLINLSYEGMQCGLSWKHNLLDIGSKIKITFIDTFQKRVTIPGEVVRIKLTRQHKADIAIFFDKSNEDDNYNFDNYFFDLETVEQDSLLDYSHD